MQSIEGSRVRLLCDQLHAESIFHLSLHSKELFHSNLLAWFCEAHPDAATEVLRCWVPSRETSMHRVQRERRHLDLVVEMPGLAPVVIENKVFAPPDDAQLERYSSEHLAGIDSPTLLLLSLGAPNWRDSVFTDTSGATWRHVSYRDLAIAMDDIVSSIPGFDGELLRRYLRFIRLLQELVEEVGEPGLDESIALDPATRGDLQSIRLHDAIGKLRARCAIASVSRSMEELFCDETVRFDANFTNGQPLVEAFIRCDDGDWIGWQYQGDQWRLAVITDIHLGKTAESRARRQEYVARKYIGWFDFTEISELIGRASEKIPPRESAGDFNGYNPNFVYRYRALPRLSLAELTTLSHHYLLRAREWAVLSTPSAP